MIDNKLLDDITAAAKESPRLRMNYNIHESLESPCQRLINVLLPGTSISIHRHQSTAETYIILRGRISVRFHNKAGEITKQFMLDPSSGNYGINIPVGQWHSVDVIEPSAIFEVKEGPYKPIAADDILKIHE